MHRVTITGHDHHDDHATMAITGHDHRDPMMVTGHDHRVMTTCNQHRGPGDIA
jgi:hypothetical protein